jgi:flagellar FliL protein
MATSPTVLAGASPSSSPVPANTAAPVAAPVAAKFPIVPLLISVASGVVLATLCVGGGVYYLAHAGRLPLQGAATQKTESVALATTHAMVLEPLLVNLADAGGSSYLRVALTLRVADVVDKKAANADGGKTKDDKSGDDGVAAARDTVLAVLGRQSADGLLAADGKERLKIELKAALAEHNADLKVKDIFFTDFLVQR